MVERGAAVSANAADIPPIGCVVLVRGRGLRPWRAKVVRHGPRLIGAWSYGSGSCEVLPLESGIGWSTEPVVVRLDILERER